MVFPSGRDADLPSPDPFWLTLLATLCGLVVPAVTAIGAVILLGPPSIPHTSKLATIAAGALTLAEAVFAGLVAAALVEAAWSRLRLPGSGPVEYLPVRWTRRRIARRRAIALSRGEVPRRGRSGRISRLCTEVGGALGLSGAECERARVAALADPGLRMGEETASERLAAVVAAYDALLADQPERPALSRRQALAELRAMSRTSLDPDIVETLIEVEAANGKVRLGPFASALSGVVRRGRHIVRTSVTPAAAGATVLAMATAGLLGVLPAWQGTRVLGLRYQGPSVVVQTTPTDTGPADTPSPSVGSSPKPPPTPTPPRGTASAGRPPGLYFPPPPRTGLPSAAPAHPAPPATPAVVYVTQSALPITVLPPSPSATATPTPSPTKSTSPPPGGPVADRYVWVNQAGPMPALASPPLSTTSAKELILAFVSSDGPATGQSVSSVSGAGLNWSLAARSNTLSGTAEVWQAYATTRLTGVTIVAVFANSGHAGSMTVAAFSGAAAAVGATGVGGAASGAPQVSVTTSKARSVVWAVGHDPDQAVPHSPLTGQTIVHEFLDPAGGDTGWVQASGPTSAANSVVMMGDSVPTLDRWELAAVEIPPAP